MILSFLTWYLLLLLAGLSVLPIVSTIFSSLPDRGYAFSKIFGLLLWGYIFWLLGSLRVLQNDSGGILLALVIVFLISILALKRNGLNESLRWIRTSRVNILVTEALFLAAFAGWALIRVADPAALGTEKPMELAFINAILRSPSFPPHDPWLSGYAISYYYFGYVLVAMLAKLSAIPGSVAFNLAVASWFGLTACGGFGMLFNLLSRLKGGGEATAPLFSKKGASLWSLLGPFFILLVSNLEGFLEVLHRKGLFWRKNLDGSLTSTFWKWLDIQELANPPGLPFSFIPQRAGGIWWWRASRVLQDYDLSGNSREIIDEFPFFSYLLSDLHPHVLAMPFVLLASGLALNLFYSGEGIQTENKGLIHSIRDWMTGRPFLWSAIQPGGFLRQLNTWATVLTLGGLAFLNTWDFPIYLGLYCAVLVFLRYQKTGWKIQLVAEFLEFAILLAIPSLILYLPFHLGFASQAGGVIPSMVFFTRGIHFWVMFAPLLIPILIWMVWSGLRQKKKIDLRTGAVLSGGLILGLWVVSTLLGWFVALMPVLGNQIFRNSSSPFFTRIATNLVAVGNLFYGTQGSSNPEMILFGSIGKRIQQPGTWLTLFILLAGVWSLLGLFRNSRQQPDEAYERLPAQPQPDAFVLLIVFVGIGLALVPEYFYLRDQFGWRMNTIFKFYFQTWILWAVASAYASAVLWKKLQSSWKTIFRTGWFLLLAAALVYTFFGLRMKIQSISGDFTLDAARYLEKYSPDEGKAIAFLQSASPGVIAEAVGGSYSSFGRVSELTGDPTVLGWPGHESQWRGGATEMGSREGDIQTLYRTTDWNEAQAILEKYQIRYVYIGPQERSSYRVSEAKFASHMRMVFSNPSVVIYERILDLKGVNQ